MLIRQNTDKKIINKFNKSSFAFFILRIEKNKTNRYKRYKQTFPYIDINGKKLSFKYEKIIWENKNAKITSTLFWKFISIKFLDFS